MSDEPSTGFGPAHDPIRQVTAQISIDASVDRVWSLLTEVDLMPGLHPQMLSAHWLDGVSEADLGARFTSQNGHDELGVWESTSRIVEFEPGRRIAWTIEGLPAPPAVCRFDLVTDADSDSGLDRTLLRQSYFYDSRPGASPPVARALADCG
jgi:uncharacterized protein YndB with AHSA1/START domain